MAERAFLQSFPLPAVCLSPADPEAAIPAIPDETEGATDGEQVGEVIFLDDVTTMAAASTNPIDAQGATFPPTGGPLIPAAGVSETLRLLTDPARPRNVPMLLATAVGLVARGGMAGFRALRGWRGGPAPATGAAPPHVLPKREDGAAKLFVDNLLLNRPLFDHTDFVLTRAAELLIAGELKAFHRFVQANYHRTMPHLLPLLNSMVRHAAHHASAYLAPELNELSAILDMRLASASRARPDNPPAAFANVNILGIDGYNRRLFGVSAAQRLGVVLRPEETTLGKILMRLPAGAIVADYGGGAGVFAAEIKALRPDLDVYVNDLETPETIVAANPQAHLDAATLRRSATYLTGDAMTTCLPGGKKAGLLVANSLSQYLQDPLALIRHLYDQLAIGGSLVMSLNPAIFDADRAQRQEIGYLGREIAAELQVAGVRALWTGDTLIMRRSDRRALRVVATPYAANITAVNLAPLWAEAIGYAATVAVIDKYEVIYRPATARGPRWLGLVGRP